MSAKREAIIELHRAGYTNSENFGHPHHQT